MQYILYSWNSIRASDQALRKPLTSLAVHPGFGGRQLVREELVSHESPDVLQLLLPWGGPPAVHLVRPSGKRCQPPDFRHLRGDSKNRLWIPNQGCDALPSNEPQSGSGGVAGTLAFRFRISTGQSTPGGIDHAPPGRLPGDIESARDSTTAVRPVEDGAHPRLVVELQTTTGSRITQAIRLERIPAGKGE